MNGFPCEDSSASFSAEDGKYYIAAVADGHGSNSCFRSDYGSKAAAEVAMECLRQFAEANLALEEIEDRFYQDMFSNPRYQKMTIKQLTDTIVAEWHDRVMDHYKNNPPSAEEMGENAAEYENGKNPTHIYGTTLMAALRLPKCLILIHQGDGRCDVFYADGSVDQPIPWDKRCEGTTTTSLCDEDATGSFRSCVINLDENPIMACYLGCDGVEDAYRDTYEELGGSHVLMGGVHTFYKDLTCQLVKMEQVEFEDYLKTMLSDFSANGRFSRSGSGDDVSVAGIVDLDVIQQFAAEYEYDVKRYALEEDLFWKEDELRGKKRKHDILQKRAEEAQSAFNEAQKKQQRYEEKFRYLREKVAQAEGDRRKLLKQLGEYDGQIKKVEEAQRTGGETVKELKAKLDEARSAFEEYDTKYQAIDADRIRIEGEIAALREGKEE